MIETVSLAHVPAELVIHAALYKNVANAVYLKEQLLAGNSDFEYAFIDASMIISRNHALSAAFRAINDYHHQRLKSRNVHSEIVFALSPNTNIGEAFKKFGITNDTRDLLVLKVATHPDVRAETVDRHLVDVVKGQAVSFDDVQLYESCDLGKVRKVYKLPNTADQKGVRGGSSSSLPHTSEIKNLEVQILGLMALRGAT